MEAMTSQQKAPHTKRCRRFLTWFAGVTVAFSLFVFLTRGFWITTLRSYFIGRTYIAGQEFGRELPTVDEVEILALGGEVADGTPDSFPPDIGSRLGTVNRRTLHGVEAEQIASIWRDIDFDHHFAGLCHQPFYALRFRHHGKLILETSVCWKCSTYTLPVGVFGLFGPTQNGFDSKSETGQKLLSTLSQYAPHPPTPK